MAPSMPLLTLRGSEGQYRVNRPPHFMESTLFPRESGKNCPCCPFPGDPLAWSVQGEQTTTFYGKHIVSKGIWEKLQNLYL
uniref:Uncharacterized protein n=1 Tax=Ailuropoda melanoleuca TaxID=9646 RepID=A0A7N5JYV4_AILME